MSETLILVRHGETLHNAAGIAQGWADSELSERGRAQVERLAERIALLQPAALYSSPLGRAISTAEAISRATGLPIVANDDLREMSYGGWEGRSFLDVRREDEAAYQRWIHDETAACPDGESHADVRSRVERAIAAITAACHPERSRGISSDSAGDSSTSLGMTRRTVVVVTHGTAIRISATALLGVPVLTARQFAQDNAAINIFFRRGDRWVLKVWNDATHCEER